MKKKKRRFKRGSEKKRQELTPRQKQIKEKIERRNKSRELRFETFEEASLIKHFNIPTTVIGDLSNNALIVYVFLCSKADFEYNNWFHIKREDIAKFTGLSPMSVDKGVKDLLQAANVIMDTGKKKEKKIYLLERKKQSNRSKHYYLYRVGFIRSNLKYNKSFEGNYINLQSMLFDTGIWAELSKKAKLLYLAMRKYCKFDLELYADIEYESPYLISQIEFNEIKWFICNYSLSKLCHNVGINRVNIKDAYIELYEKGLIENDGSGRLTASLVYRMPKFIYDMGKV